MTQISLRLRALLGLCLALLLGLTVAPRVQAAWTGGGTGPSSALAYTMPSGSQPSARASGSTVSLRWSAVVFPGGQSVAGYVIHRFDAINGAQATVGAGCSGIVPTTTCTEHNVPSGTWVYTDTPVHNNWTGGQSAASATVSVP
jgi:hypothetical protein